MRNVSLSTSLSINASFINTQSFISYLFTRQSSVENTY